MNRLAPILAVSLLFINGANLQAQDTTDAGTATSTASSSASQGTSIWSMLGLSHSNLAKCKTRFCASGIGQMAKAMFTPMSAMTGGLFSPGCCPDVLNAAQLAALSQPGAASPAEQAAAQIKANVAGAAERRAAVRYLGTVDCHYFPEAEKGILAALRGDPIECVRMEAAIVLGTGCCCTRKTIEALTIVVTGSNKDGNPSETSERVKFAASLALKRCMSVPLPSIEPQQPEAPVAMYPAAQPIQTAAYVAPVPAPLSAQVPGVRRQRNGTVLQAQRYLAENISAPKVNTFVPSGQRSLYNIFVQAGQPTEIKGEPAIVQVEAKSRVQPLPPLRPIGPIPAWANSPAPAIMPAMPAQYSQRRD